MDASRSYRLTHDLCWARKDAISANITASLPHCEQVSSYGRGGPKQPAYYAGPDPIVPRPLLLAAMEEVKTLGIRYADGLIFSTVKPGVRQEWDFSGKSLKWVKVRRWVKINGEWEAPSLSSRRYTARTRVIIRAAKRCVATELRGKKAISKDCGYYAVGVEKAARNNVAFLLRTYFRPAKSAVSQAALMRALYRLCPAGCTVVITPASQGAEPSPAYRETATGEEYHVGASRRPAQEALAAFAKRSVNREETALAVLVERGEADDVYICAADSIRAGNCKAGTESYASRHALDVHRHYRAGELRKQANGDARFVRAAILAGLRRTRRENQQGFALLEEHSI
jgi:hypothetical protein